MRNFMDLLQNRWEEKHTLLCVGLDSDYEKIPVIVKNKYSSPLDSILEFNKTIIDRTAEYVCCYKPQYAFYGSLGNDGLTALKETISYIHKTYSDIPVILDSKRGDIGSTSKEYVKEAFEIFSADAVTVNPYGGFDGIEPFLEEREKGIIIWCRSSNRGASDIQDIVDKETGMHIYELVAQKAKEYNKHSNICLVVGATYPEQMKTLRELVGDDMPFLVPGLGAQGGKVEDLINGFNSKKTGVIASASRSIIFASSDENFAEKAGEEAKKLRDEIYSHR